MPRRNNKNVGYIKMSRIKKISKQLIFLLLTLVIMGCSDSAEQKAQQAFSQKKYHKAFSLYKKAIANKPGKGELYDKLERTTAHILHEGAELVKKSEFKKAIQTLATVALDKDYPSIDGKIIAGIAYLRLYFTAPDHIALAFNAFMSGIRQSKNRIPMAGIHRPVFTWAVENGLPEKDILYNSFRNVYDLGSVYRILFYYDLANRIAKNHTHTPSYLKESEEKVIQVHSLFSWCIQNLKVVKESLPVSPAWDFLRGYSTFENQNIGFILLCQQLGLQSHLLQTTDDKLYSIVNIGENWVFADLQSHRFLQKGQQVTFSLEEGLQLLDAADKATIWLVFPPRSILPRFSLFSIFHSFYDLPSANFHYNIDTNVEKLYKDLGKSYTPSKSTELTITTEGVSVNLYPKLIETWTRHNHKKDEKLASEWQKERPLKSTSQMILHSFLQKKETVFAFMKNTTESSNKENLVYYHAWSLKNIGEYDKAKEEFAKYLQMYSDGFWVESVYVHLGDIALNQEQKDKSAEYYAKTFLKDSALIK